MESFAVWQTVLDVGGVFYNAWYWAKTQNAVGGEQPVNCQLGGVGPVPVQCVYGENQPASYLGASVPLIVNQSSAANGLVNATFQVRQGGRPHWPSKQLRASLPPPPPPPQGRRMWLLHTAHVLVSVVAGRFSAA